VTPTGLLAALAFGLSNRPPAVMRGEPLTVERQESFTDFVKLAMTVGQRCRRGGLAGFSGRCVDLFRDATFARVVFKRLLLSVLSMLVVLVLH
jgi:hypothetical protein